MARISTHMDAFAIVLNEPNPSVIEDIKSKYRNHYRISDSCILVADEMLSGTNASSISNRIKLNDGHMGLVVKLNGSYAGYNYTGLWDWINSVKD